MDDDRRKELLKKLKSGETKKIKDEDGKKNVRKLPRPGGFLLEEILPGGQESDEYIERVLKPAEAQSKQEKFVLNVKWLVAYEEKKTQLVKTVSSTSLPASVKAEAQNQLDQINQKIHETEKILKNNEK